MLVGVHEDLPPGDLRRKYPGMNATRKFIPGVQGPSSSLTQKYNAVALLSWDNGLVPFVSFKTDPEQTIAGEHDRQIHELCEWLQDKPESYTIWYHEPEDNMDADTFQQAFRRVISIFHDYRNLKLGYVAMAYQWRLGQNSTRDIYIHDWQYAMEVADFVSVDLYSGNTQLPDTTIFEHEGFLRWYLHIGQYSKWGITERGFKGDHLDVLRADTIAQDRRILKNLSDPPFAYLHWNTPGAENDPTLVNGPYATMALTKLIARLNPV